MPIESVSGGFYTPPPERSKAKAGAQPLFRLPDDKQLPDTTHRCGKERALFGRAKEMVQAQVNSVVGQGVPVDLGKLMSVLGRIFGSQR